MKKEGGQNAFAFCHTLFFGFFSLFICDVRIYFVLLRQKEEKWLKKNHLPLSTALCAT